MRKAWPRRLRTGQNSSHDPVAQIHRPPRQRRSDSRTRPRPGWSHLLYTKKSGKPVFLPIPEFLKDALDNLPLPKGTERASKRFFWSGNGITRAFIRGVTRTLALVFEISGVEGAHAHHFRHTLATALLEKGWTIEDIAIVLGSPRHHPAILCAMDNSAAGTYFEPGARRVGSQIFVRFKKLPVTVASKWDNLVDGMGFEPTTPTLRTWCSPN